MSSEPILRAPDYAAFVDNPTAYGPAVEEAYIEWQKSYEKWMELNAKGQKRQRDTSAEERVAAQLDDDVGNAEEVEQSDGPAAKRPRQTSPSMDGARPPCDLCIKSWQSPNGQRVASCYVPTRDARCTRCVEKRKKCSLMNKGGPREIILREWFKYHGQNAAAAEPVAPPRPSSAPRRTAPRKSSVGKSRLDKAPGPTRRRDISSGSSSSGSATPPARPATEPVFVPHDAAALRVAPQLDWVRGADVKRLQGRYEGAERELGNTVGTTRANGDNTALMVAGLVSADAELEEKATIAMDGVARLPVEAMRTVKSGVAQLLGKMETCAL